VEAEIFRGVSPSPVAFELKVPTAPGVFPVPPTIAPETLLPT
jgi:hypothetical protein